MLLIDFLEIIKGNTHADVAASSDATGGDALGYNWDLEIHKGDIEAKPLGDSPALMDLAGKLANINFSLGPSNVVTVGSYTDPAQNAQFHEDGGTNYILTFDGLINGTKAGNFYMYAGYGGFESQITMSFAAGQNFDISSFFFYTSTAGTFSFTSDAGGTVTRTFGTNQGATIYLSTLPNTTTRLTITSTANFAAVIDNVVFASIGSVAPTVSTSAAASITGSSASLGGNVLLSGGSAVTERGVVYSSSDTDPNIGDAGVTKDTNGTGTGSFSETISGLSTSTTYYFKAYAINGLGTSYGSVSNFTTTAGNLAPTNIALSASAINENVAANSTVGTLSTTDANAGDTFTYTLVAGTGSTDNASFNISGSSLRITASPDFETKSSYSVRVRTTDQGSLTFEKQFTITINDVNEAPTDIALSASAVNENVAANTTVGTLSSTDADAGNTFTYTLVAGTGSTDNASFNISGSSLRITASPDFETKSSYSIRVRTTDQGSLTFEKQFTITINDLVEGVLLSSSPTLTFTSNPAAITGDDIASDGEGGSQAISDIDIDIYNISNTSGTLYAALSWQNNSFMGSSNISYSGLTNENNAGSKGMAIKSATGAEFRLNQFVYYNWGETFSFTNTVKGYRDGAEVASTTFEGWNTTYTPQTITLTSAFQNVDEVRFYISAGGYMGDQSSTNHSINSISVSSPVLNSAPTDIALTASSVNENVAANTTVGTLSSTDPDVGDTFSYTLVSGTGSTDNASFNISGSSLRITASPDFETKSSYSIRVRTTDQGSLTFEKQFTITINDVNEVPTDMALSASAVNENVAANTTVGTLSTTDADAGNTFTYTLVAGAGSTDNASFNISGSSLRITASPDFETKSSYSIRVRTTDQGSLTFEKQFTITINDVNEGPTDMALSASAVDENVAANTTVGTLSTTDADAGNTFTYTLVAGTGSTDNASFNISGSSLRITASPDFETKSSYSIRVRTTDQGSLTFEKQFTVTINDVNEVPTDMALSASAVDENVAANTTVGTLSTTDADAGNTFTYTLVAGAGSTDNASFNISGSSLRITASPDFETKSSYSIRVRTTDQGSLTFEKQFTVTINDVNETPTDLSVSSSSVNENVAANAVVGTLSTTDVDAGNTFTYTLVAGSGDTDNASFNISGNSLRISNTPDFETKSSYSVRVRTTDQGSLTFEKQFTITINDVNEAPADVLLSAASMDENVAANTTVGSLSSTDEDAANTFTYTLVAGAGSTDNASFNISGTSLRITNSPDFETKSSYSIRVRTTDQGSLTFEKQFTVTINDLNDAPSDIGLTASAVNENVAANTTVGTLSSADEDAGNTFTYTLVSGSGDADNASFSISGTSLQINGSPDFETKSSYSIRVRTTDQGSLTFDKQFTITINDVNEVPTDMALSATAVDENVAANTTVGTLSTTDVDAGSTFTYTLVAGSGDTDNAAFNISGSSLRITASPDFETKSSYSVRVSTTDQGSLTFEKQFTITINDLNEAPANLSLSSSSVDENVAANATVGTLSSTDEDAANTFTYTLVSGAGSTDNASFNISGTSLQISNSPDFETKSSYSVRLRTTDQGSLTFEKQFTITINDVNEAPSAIALSASAVDENVAANTTVGTLSTTDADAGNTFTYTLVAGSGDADNASFNISGSSLRISNSPDFETKSSYSVRVRTTDQGSLTFDETFTITINDLDDTPPTVSGILVAGSPAQNATSVDFDVTFSEVVTNVTADDFSVDGVGVTGSITGITGSGANYTLTVSSVAGVGTISVDLKPSGTGIIDGSSNAITVGFTAGATHAVDTQPPTMVIASSAGDPTNQNPIPATVTFNEAVTGFTVTDLNVTGATVSNFSGTGTTYTFSLTPTSDGTVTVNVSSSLATDAAGNGNTAATPFSINYDGTAPVGFGASFIDVAVNSMNERQIVFKIELGEVGSTYQYTIKNTDAGKSGEVASTGTLSESTQNFTVDLSSLANGTLALSVTLTDAAGNTSIPAVDEITKSSGGKEVPQGFSPNGDGVDDDWFIPGIDQYPNNEVKIFNRYGQLVWQTKGYTNGANSWNSSSNVSNVFGSTGLPDGTYFYVINLGDQKTASKSGYVIIKR